MVLAIFVMPQISITVFLMVESVYIFFIGDSSLNLISIAFCVNLRSAMRLWVTVPKVAYTALVSVYI